MNESALNTEVSVTVGIDREALARREVEAVTETFLHETAGRESQLWGFSADVGHGARCCVDAAAKPVHS
jgi:hypothetical protein